MESPSDGSPRPPVDEPVFNRVGTFETLQDGSLLPTLSVEEEQPSIDVTIFQGGRPPATRP